MKQIHLNFGQRIIVWNVLGPYPAKHIKEASALLKIYKDICPTDEELRDSQFLIEGGRMKWDEQYVAGRDLEIGDEEAQMFAPVLESMPMRIVDAIWIVPLIETLKGEAHTEVPQ